jgi:hypothetical protein
MALKRIYKDQAFLNPALAPAVLQDMAQTMADTFAIDLADLLRTNIPGMKETDPETGEEMEYPAIGLDEAGLIQIAADPASLGALALVISYGPETDFVQPDPEAAPMAVPRAVYLLNLPSVADMFGNAKLAEARDDLMRRHLVAAARKIVREDEKGTAPLVVDRIAALLTVTGRGGANKLEEAYAVMFRAIQHLVLGQAKTLAKRLRDQNQHAKARDVEHVFTASRFNKANVKASFQSRAAAEYHFPTLPQAQWENLLRAAIAAAPKFSPLVPVRDAEGKLVKDAEGKTVTQQVQKPQSPAIFQQWLATRDAVAFNPPEDGGTVPTMTFDGLSM